MSARELLLPDHWRWSKNAPEDCPRAKDEANSQTNSSTHHCTHSSDHCKQNSANKEKFPYFTVGDISERNISNLGMHTFVPNRRILASWRWSWCCHFCGTKSEDKSRRDRNVMIMSAFFPYGQQAQISVYS